MTANLMFRVTEMQNTGIRNNTWIARNTEILLDTHNVLDNKLFAMVVQIQ